MKSRASLLPRRQAQSWRNAVSRSPGPALLLKVAVSAILLATFARTFIVQGVFIPSGSMQPTLYPGDHVLVGKLLYQPPRDGLLRILRPSREVRRHDVLIFRSPLDPSTLLVKRCLGLPGEQISVRNGAVSIDGRRLPDDVHAPPGPSVATTTGFLDRVKVPPGHYFVLGDNRPESFDSRNLGPIPHSALVGRALLVYWSFRPPSTGAPARSPRARVGTTHWRRLLRFVR